MKLIYIYHSGFAIEADGVTVIIDYYKDSPDRATGKSIVNEELLSRPGRIYVLSTHVHPDHFDREILSWKKKRPDIKYIFSKDILEHGAARKEDAVFLMKEEVYKDQSIYVEAFGSTDVGISFFIELQGLRIFHAGDLNNWHWNEESTAQEIQKAESDYSSELNFLKQHHPEIDLAMFPVDARLGKDYMKGAKQFIEQIKTSIFVPMHFGESYEKANAFRTIAEGAGCRFLAITYRGQTFDITK